MPSLPPGRRTALRLCALALAIGLPQSLPAQAVVRDSTARVERLADGVYAIVHDRATDYWSHSNTGVIVGEDAVLVIDATYLPSRARGDIALIRKLTDRPVRYLAFTHWHDDHTNGAIAYSEAYPGLAIMADRDMARFIEITGPSHAREASLPGSDEHVRLSEMEAALSGGRDSTGVLSDSARRLLVLHVAQRRNELAELASFVMVPPTLRYQGDLRLDLGHKIVEFRNWGRGNSTNDVSFYVPDALALFTGDLLVQDPVPYYSSSWPVPWIQVLAGLEQYPVRAIVPGHGPVFHDQRYLHLVHTVMATVVATVDSMTRAGASIEEMQARSNAVADHFRQEWPAWSDPSNQGLWSRGINRLVERAWRGIRGQGG